MRHVFSIIWLSEHIRALYCWCLFCYLILGLITFILHFQCFTFTSPVELFGWLIKPPFIFYFFLSFFSLLLFSLFSFLELAYGNIGSGWDLVGTHIWRLLFQCLFFLLIHIMWVLCFCYIQLIYTRFFARIHDLPYYTPALRSIVRSSSSKYNCNVDPSSTQLTPSDPETWSSPHRHRGSSYSGRCTTPYVCIHNISQMIFVIFMILLVQN